MSLLVAGCASAELRSVFSDETRGVTVVGAEQIPIPGEPYPYYAGTLFDLTCLARPLTSLPLWPGAPSIRPGDRGPSRARS